MKNTIRADQVKAGQAIFINFRAAYVVSVEQQGEGGLFKIEWHDAHDGDHFIRNNLMSGSVELPALPDGVMWPSPLVMSERLLEWQRRGLQYTATGDLGTAVESAIKKGYGAAGFYRDTGLSIGRDALAGPQYGQIGRLLKTGGADMITGRVCIRAEILGDL